MGKHLAEEIHKKMPFDSLEQEAFLNLLRTAQALTDAFDRLFKTAKLSPTQYNVLRILRGAAGPLPCGHISGMMVTRDPDITRLLDRLESARQIVRRRSPKDRRVVLAEITPAGLKVLAKLEQPVIELHAEQMKHIPKAKLRQLIALLELTREPQPVE